MKIVGLLVGIGAIAVAALIFWPREPPPDPWEPLRREAKSAVSANLLVGSNDEAVRASMRSLTDTCDAVSRFESATPQDGDDPPPPRPPEFHRLDTVCALAPPLFAMRGEPLVVEEAHAQLRFGFSEASPDRGPYDIQVSCSVGQGSVPLVLQLRVTLLRHIVGLVASPPSWRVDSNRDSNGREHRDSTARRCGP